MLEFLKCNRWQSEYPWQVETPMGSDITALMVSEV
jgi:hypothetical protein